MNSLFGDYDMAKLMMGERAFHIPVNFIAQQTDKGSDKVAGVWQSSMGKPLFPDDKFIHVLTLGDMIFRPRLMIGSNSFSGRGISSLYKDGFIDMDKWVNEGEVILKLFE